MTGGKGGHGGGKGPHKTRQFFRHLRMKRALGIQSIGRMRLARQMRGRDRRRGTWWDLKLNRVAIEGQDFAQDTEEEGADQFVLIPNSDEERSAKGSSMLGDDDEYVPETEPQDVATVSTITGPCASQGRRRLGTLLHDWLRIISDVDNESGKVQPESAKVEMESSKLEMCAKEQPNSVKLEESAKVEMDSSKLEMCAKEQMGGVKLEMEGGKLDSVKLEIESAKLGSVKLEEKLDHMASFSDIETDDKGWSFQDGVDLRGYSQEEDEDFNG
ncbi:unnamed protein product [Urochloa humidicola]